LSTKAVDELYVLIVSFCNLIETFFQPFYPVEVTYDLHSDFMLLSQHLLFKRQEDGKVYECLTILMRVDSQLDDKDLREKMRLMQGYTPMDFGVDKEFSMMSEAAKEAQRKNDESSLTNPRMVSINRSGLQSIVENNPSNISALIETASKDASFTHDYQEMREEVKNSGN